MECRTNHALLRPSLVLFALECFKNIHLTTAMLIFFTPSCRKTGCPEQKLRRLTTHNIIEMTIESGYYREHIFKNCFEFMINDDNILLVKLECLLKRDFEKTGKIIVRF